MPVQTVNEGLDGWLVQVTDVASCLTRLLASHKGLRIDRPESVNDHFASDGLDRVDDDGDSSWVELLKGLLVS
jgi:hypothetical protein